MPEVIDQKNARIFWNENEKGEIKELFVVHDKYDKDGKFDMYSYSGGSCICDFDKETPLGILVYYCIGRHFADDKTRIRALAQLYKIKELRAALRNEAKRTPVIRDIEIPYLIEEI